MVREGDGWKTRCSFDYLIPFQVKFLSQSASCAMRFTANGRRDLSPIQVRFVGATIRTRYQVPYALHSLLLLSRVEIPLCADHVPYSLLPVHRFVKNICIHGTHFLPTILIIATKTRKEFRESRKIDTYTYTLGKYVHMAACVSRETHRASVCKYLNGKRTFNQGGERGGGNIRAGEKKQRKYINPPFFSLFFF